MAALTAYQIQFRQRAKKTIQRRANADRRVRAYARLLAAALDEAGAAAEAVDLLNQTYKVDVSTQTLLVKSLLDNIGAKLLAEALAKNPLVEEAVSFNQVPDANGGEPLAANAVFGERVAAKYSAKHTVTETE